MSEIILFLHEDGAENGVPQAMADFEIANTVRLPDLYKKIVGTFDEASIYPNLFFPKMPPEVFDNIQSGANFSDFSALRWRWRLGTAKTMAQESRQVCSFWAAQAGGSKF